jgi:hypothetical protein
MKRDEKRKSREKQQKDKIKKRETKITDKKVKIGRIEKRKKDDLICLTNLTTEKLEFRKEK